MTRKHSLISWPTWMLVPAGEGWTVTEPFEPVIKDGKLYGRGTADDKGPAVTALYAMRAVKRTGTSGKKCPPDLRHR